MNFYLLYGTDTSIIGREIDIIKEKADEVCLSVKEDGVYYKLKDLFDLS